MFGEEHLFWYRAKLNPSTRDVIGVVDGDTFNVVVDMGRFIYTHTALRLYGINAPEMSTQAGKDAKAWAVQWMTSRCPGGVFVIKSNGPDPNDKYGRLLATVYAPDGTCYNEEIVAEGHAVVYLP